MRCLIFIALLVVLQKSAIAIGNRTHAEIGERSISFLAENDEMLPGIEGIFAKDVNRLALYAGCTFPDWGYGGLFHDAGEDAHWWPFHLAYFDVLKDTLSKEWTAENELDFAFFCGVISHSISDLPWHFDNGLHKSFIRAAIDAEGSDHGMCDTGSDMFMHKIENIEPPFMLEDWHWPLELLYAAYEKSGRVVARSLLTTAETRQRAVVMGGSQLSIWQFASRKERSPWVFDHMFDYYYGGVDNGAAATAMWTRYWYARFKGWHYFQDMPNYGDLGGGVRGYDGIADATISERHPQRNTGAEPLITVGGIEGERSKTLLRIEMEEIPPETNVSKATLWLFVEAADSSATIIACAAGFDWSEGGGQSDVVNGTHGREATEGEVNWSSYEAQSSSTRGLAGETEDDKLDSREITRDDIGHWVSFDLTDVVTAWVRDPAANNGVVLNVESTRSGTIRFYSSEAWKVQADGFGGGGRVNYRPVVVVQPSL